MTMQGTDLTGARVTDAGGKVVGKVDKVFNDDLDGKPVWALIRAGKASRFIPVRGSRMTADGFSVPFDSQKIMNGPDLNVDQHMSADQVTELRRYYGLAVPAQAGQPAGEPTGQQAAQQAGQQAGQQAAPTSQQASPQAGRQAGRADLSSAAAEVWLVRNEERMDIGTEVLESRRVRLRKYVDVQPVEQAVHVFHEEYEVEHIPITAEERARGPIAENDQELILHEQRAVFKKEAVPVERIRLVTKRVEEDRTFREELRKERIEVEPDGDTATPRAGQLPEQNEHRSVLGRHRSLSAPGRAGLSARG
jgi:stress response protein YsnF